MCFKFQTIASAFILFCFVFQAILKEKDFISKESGNKIDSLGEGDTFLIQKQKEKREREKQKEREAEQAREQQLRNKLGAGESKSLDQLKNKKKDSHGVSNSLSNRHSSVHIPQFYFPLGQPCGEDLDAIQQRLREEFSKMEGGKVQRLQMGPILKVININLSIYIGLIYGSVHLGG